MHLFYQPDLSKHQIQLSEEESKHCIRVLRLKSNDQIFLVDGKGTKAVGKVMDDNPKKCLVQVMEKQIEPKQFDYNLQIFIAPPKSPERLDWFVEKAVELGVDEIYFMTTRNSERNKVNIERCEKIAISAMKQSKQWYKPVFYPPKPIEQIISPNNIDGLKLIAWCETDKQYPLKRALTNSKHKNVNIMIGPEGDFTNDEVTTALEFGFEKVSLGNSILRTETAAIYVIASCRFHFDI
jgi:16S rRNA (uracil1498-N3)-methyltransferase